MTNDEIAAFADKRIAHNERIVIVLKDNKTYTGFFFNNPKIVNRENSLWNFVIPKTGNEPLENVSINGNDIESINIIQLF